MASAYPPSSASALPHRSAPFKSPAMTSNAPQGTFLPTTKVQVGSHRVVIEKYLSEGGFAHVYVVRVPRDNNKHELAVLKRVAVPDKEHLASMRTEVETMKKLKGHKHVVTYMDSHASQLKGGGYEVFLLMEYCSGGGLIDFMNTRLQHRLTEPEILKIFGDVAEGVACMHYLKPPLLHRDLKVENVLISKSPTSGAPTYKLCDFGSTAPPRPAAKTADEGRLIEEDVQKHTTMQYRSPEMIDVWRKQPIDEKADIWALGVLLYKLCYYTTPFEDVGQMAILNASYKYPSYPRFSDRLKKFVASMLKEDPKHRPNIYRVIKEACSMRGTDVPIKDIYANRTHSEARRNESLPSLEPVMSVGLQIEAPQVQVQAIPEIAPMRRGRPTAPATQAPVAARPSPSPARGDPFAALDSKSYDVRVGAVDELSKRFPSLDEFPIVHEKGGKVSFSSQSPRQSSDSSSTKLNERVANALADEVFSQSKPKADVPKSHSTSQLQQPTISPTKSSSVKAKVSEMSKQSPLVHQPTPVRLDVTYTSTATGASPPSSARKAKFPEISKRSIWRVPDHHRSSSQPRASESAQAAAATLQPSLPPTQRPALIDIHRSKSQTATPNAAKSPTSSRPSLEGHRPSQLELGEESSLYRAKSAQSRPRPSSAYVNSNLDYLRDQESARKRPSIEGRRHSRQPSRDAGRASEDKNIDDDMDYLRQSEDNERRLPSRKGSGHHKKRSSLSSISGGAKHIFAGRFGDAFKRFETHSGDDKNTEVAPLTPEPRDNEDEPRLLSPIEGSEATPSKHSDPDSAIDETEDLPPDMRRELERRRLSQEERRVAEAAAEYRARGNSSAPTKASTIQRRVQSLLDESQHTPVQSKRTAEGYGRYADNSEAESRPSPNTALPNSKAAPPPISRKPITTPEASNNPFPQTSQQPSQTSTPVIPAIPPASAPPTQQPTSSPRVISRPSVPPKSQALRTGGSNKPQWPPPEPDTQKPLPPKPTGGLAALLAKDLEGVPDYPPRGSSAEAGAKTPNANIGLGLRANGPATETQIEDLEADFHKRYPNLTGIEMVETEIEGQSRTMSVREV